MCCCAEPYRPIDKTHFIRDLYFFFSFFSLSLSLSSTSLSFSSGIYCERVWSEYIALATMVAELYFFCICWLFESRECVRWFFDSLLRTFVHTHSFGFRFFFFFFFRCCLPDIHGRKNETQLSVSFIRYMWLRACFVAFAHESNH